MASELCRHPFKEGAAERNRNRRHKVLDATPVADGEAALNGIAAESSLYGVEMAPIRQAWAAGAQRLLTATAIVQRAGTFINCGDSESGPTVVDRAIIAAEESLTGANKAFATNPAFA